MKPDCKVDTDTEEIIKIRGTILGAGLASPDAKWDYAFAQIEDGYIRLDSAGGAALDRKHALLFAQRLTEMAYRLPRDND